MGLNSFILECEKQNRKLEKDVEYYKNKSRRSETQLKKQKEIIDKAKKYVIEYKNQFDRNDDVVGDMKILLSILEDKEV